MHIGDVSLIFAGGNSFENGYLEPLTDVEILKVPDDDNLTIPSLPKDYLSQGNMLLFQHGRVILACINEKMTDDEDKMGKW